MPIVFKMRKEAFPEFPHAEEWHVVSALNREYSACGMALDGTTPAPPRDAQGKQLEYNGGHGYFYAHTRGKLTCPICIQVVKHYKSIRL